MCTLKIGYTFKKKHNSFFMNV